MKAQVYSLAGIKKGEILLPKSFSQRIREDIVLKYFEAEKISQPYSAAPEAGRRHSAAGTISHKRHDWKGHYGQGRSRAPRKTMWRRGTNFYWVGAEVSGARGGRKAHAPELNKSFPKLNKKEKILALNSCLAATMSKEHIIKRYSGISDFENKMPIIIEFGSEKLKTKSFIDLVKKILGENYEIAFKKKRVRSGRGKTRGRKYKSNAGLLLVKAEKEKIKLNGIDLVSLSDLKVSDLYPLGRITFYTEEAIKEMGAKNDS